MKNLEIKNPLKVIQVISKIAKVISTIVYVCCIIGFVGCFIALLALPSAKNIVVDGKTIETIMREEANMSINSMIMYMLIGLIICAVNTYIAYLTKNYFKKELEDGDPFTHSGANQLLRLSLIQVISSILVSIVSTIIFAIFKSIYGDIVDYEFINNISLDVGITFFVLSLIFKYGANLRDPKNDNNETNEVEKEDYIDTEYKY